MKKLISLLLALALPLQAVAASMDCTRQNGNVSSTDCIWNLVTEFEKQAATQNGGQLPQTVQDVVLQDELNAIATEVSALYTVDYNLFLMQSLQHYEQNPAERAILFELWQIIRSDLASVFQTPQTAYSDAAVRGLGEYATIALLAWGGISLLRGKMPINLLKLPTIAASDDATLAAEKAVASVSRTQAIVSKVVQNGKTMLTAAAVGVSISELQEYIDRDTDQRMDPTPAFQIIQASLACALSNAALSTSLNADQLQDLEDQANLLLSEDSDLSNLYKTSDRLQSAIASVPVDQQWSTALLQPMNCNEVSFASDSPFMTDLSQRISALKAAQPPVPSKSP